MNLQYTLFVSQEIRLYKRNTSKYRVRSKRDEESKIVVFCEIFIYNKLLCNGGLGSDQKGFQQPEYRLPVVASSSGEVF